MHPILKEAIRLCEAGSCPDILISDAIMQNMTALSLANRLPEMLPKMAFLVMSGWEKETLLARKAINDGDHLLAKPFTHRSSVPPCNARYRGRGLTRPRRRKRPEVGLTQVLEQNVAGLGCSLPNTHPERHLPERAGRSPGRVLKHGSVRRTYLSVLILAGNSTYAILLTTTD